MPVPAHRDAIDEHRRHAVVDRHPLAVLAAHPTDVLDPQIGANHGDPVHAIRPVADQVGGADWRRHAAVLDEVGLHGAEDEIAVGDVDLPPGEADAVDAALDGTHDLLGRSFAGAHKGRGHAGHGDVAETLPPAAAAGRDPKVFGGNLVVQVPAEDAVLDEDVLLRRLPFVVDVDAAVAPRQGAVVDDGAER